jgi:adhesin/invasin
MNRKRALRLLGFITIAGLALGCGSSGGDGRSITASVAPTVPTPPAGGVPNNSTSSVTATPNSGVIANGSSTSSIAVTVRDVAGNPLGGQAVTLAVTGTGNLLSPTSGATNISGVFAATLSSTTAQSKTITATINPGATQIVLTQQPVVVFDPTPAGSPDATQSTVVATPLTGLAANGTDTSAITVTVRDSTGAALAMQTVNLSSGTGTIFSPISGVTNASGVFAATVSSTQSGTKAITATVDPSGSNVVIATKPAVVFSAPAGTPDPTQSTFVANPTTGVLADGIDTSTLTVTVRDPNGAALAGQTVQLSATGGATTVNPSTGTSNASGVFTATILTTTAGTKTLTAVINPGANQVTLNTMPGVTFSAPVLPDAGTSTVTVNPATGLFATGNFSSTITVTVRDSASNLLANRTIAISATGTGNTIINSTGTTNASGVFTTTISSTVAGVKTISATAATVTSIPTPILITQQPTVTFIVVPPVADPALSTVTATPLTGILANGTDISTVTVTLRDVVNGPLANQTVMLSSTGTNNTFTPVSGTTNASGVFTATIASTIAEAKTITATADPTGTPVVINQTATVTFGALPADPGTSTVTANPTTGVVASGNATSTITVTVRDVSSNLLANQTVMLSSTGTNNTFTPVSGTTNASGVFTATLASTTAETKTITATVDPTGTPVVITQTATVVFSPVIANAATSTVTATPIMNILANGTAVSTITVTVRDAASNLLANQTVMLSATGTNNTLTPVSGTTNASGVLTATIASTTAETKTVTATVDPTGTPVVITQTAKMAFIAVPPNAPDAGTSTVTANPLTGITANGADTSTITVTARDAGSNLLSNVTVNLSATAGAAFAAATGTTNASGVFTTTLTATSQGMKTVTAVLDPAGSNVTVTQMPIVDFATAGFNVITGTAGIDSLTGTAGADQIDALDGDDRLNGLGGNDLLNGGNGNDMLMGGAGADMLNGDAGIDIADYSNSPGGVTVDLSTGLGTGSDAQGDVLTGIENLLGSPNNDVLTGDANDNLLNGNAGDDTLNGGDGVDTLIGGAGADSLNGGNQPAGMFDTVSYIASPTGVTVDLGTNTATGGDAAGDTFTGIEGLIGSPFDDRLNGDASNNLIDGGVGNDIIDGGDGDDMIIGGTGADTLTGGLGNDTMSFPNAAALVSPATELIVDLVTGTGTNSDANGDIYLGIENVIGSDLPNQIFGDAGANTIMGGASNDRIFTDGFIGSAGADVIMAGDGLDLLFLTGTDFMTADGGASLDAAVLFTDLNLSDPTINAAIANMEDFFLNPNANVGLSLTITLNAPDLTGLGGQVINFTGFGNRTCVFIYGDPGNALTLTSTVQGTGWTDLNSQFTTPRVVGLATDPTFNVYENVGLGIFLMVDANITNQAGILP